MVADALDDGVTAWELVSTDVDAVLEGLALEAGGTAALDGDKEALSDEDNEVAPVLEVGTTTMPVGVTEEKTEDASELSNVNVGKGIDETGRVTVLVTVRRVVLVSVTTVVTAELGTLLDEATTIEL